MSAGTAVRSLAAVAAACAVAGAVPVAALAGRGPTASERSAIIAGVRSGNSVVGAAPRPCDAASRIRVSTVDARYAVWWQDYQQAARIGGCVLGNGFIIVRKQPPAGRWRIRLQGSGGAPCHVIGTRIALDLVGAWFPCDRPSQSP